MAFRQPSRDIATRIRLLLLLVFKITHIYFSFLLELDMILSSHGSSLIGLPFQSLGCLPVVFVDVTCAVFWLHKRVQRLNSWCRVQIL